MKLIKPKAELLIQPNGLDGIYKQIELAGRTCYKSEDKITEDSAKVFVDRMIKSNHLAMLEHGTVYLAVSAKDDMCLILGMNPYTKNNLKDDVYYFTTNLRVLVEHKALWVLDKYLCEPTKYHERRYTFKATTSIGVTREMNRHRVNSIAEQSTRYCNYSRNKFGNEVTFIKPSWFDRRVAVTISGKYIPADAKGDFTQEEARLIESLSNAEESYIYLIKCGWQPQQAREVLPLCTASEIIHTAFASDWRFFFDLRLFGKTGNPHPNMLLLAQKMKAEAEDKDVWNDIMRYHSKF